MTQLLHSDHHYSSPAVGTAHSDSVIEGAVSSLSGGPGGPSTRCVPSPKEGGEREGGREELTRDHAKAALAQLDQIMRYWAFSQPALPRNITIL